MIPNGTRFIGIAPEVDLKERGSALLNKRTEPYTIDDIRGYKVFTALLTQNGEGESASIFFEDSLVIGRTYNIYSNDGDSADFTNVGAPNNNENTYFIATGTTPNSWGINDGAELSYNTGAPLATVLENTIGNIWFTYAELGVYTANSNNLFTDNKTYFQKVVMSSAPSFLLNNINLNFIELLPTDGDGSLLNTPIEIRVYN